MSTNLEELIKNAQLVVEEFQQKVIEAKKAVNQLAILSGIQPVYTDIEDVGSRGVGNIRNDQFFGMGVATAAAAYLKMKGSSATAQEILEGLNRGGFQFPDEWAEKYRLKNLAISLKKNAGRLGKFVWLDSLNSFGLPEFYPNLKRTDSKKANPNSDEQVKTESKKEDKEDDKTTKEDVKEKIETKKTISEKVGDLLNEN